MKEGIDYQLIPVDVDNEQAWDVRILSGEFAEAVIRFGNVQLDGNTGTLKFNFNVVNFLGEDVTPENESLQLTAGDILSDIISNSIEDGSAVLDEVGTNELQSRENDT